MVRDDENFLGKLDEIEEPSPYVILQSLLGKQDLEMKTEIPSPTKMASAWTIAEDLRSKGLGEVADLIQEYIERLLLYYVSKDRKSRAEIVEGLKAITEKPSDELSRLMADKSV